MTSLAAVEGIVVVVEERVNQDLRQIARTHSLSILEAPSARAAFRDVVCLQPRVVVVQVSHSLGEAVEFIRLAMGFALTAPILAVATAHTDEVEQAARKAGSTWYLPDASPSIVDEILATVLSRQKSSRTAARPERGA